MSTATATRVQDFQARQIELIGSAFAFWLGTTKSDKLDWKPKAEGEASQCRSALEQVAECVGVNRGFAAVLRGEKPPERGEDVPFTDLEDAQRQITDSTKEFADAVRGLDDGFLDKKYMTPFGELAGMTMVTLPAMNMQYHSGQVNFLQTLYGDTEFRMPGRP